MYTYDMRVGFSQSNKDKLMTIPAIIDTFQDCSCFHSDDIGVGFDYLEPINLVWIINYWEVEIQRHPRYGSRITVGTFPYDFKGFFGYRNFFLEDEDGYMVKANSLWILMDWANMRPAKVTKEMVEGYVTEPKLEMDYSSRKILIPETSEKSEADPIVITGHHLDSNGHVNNGQYIKIATGSFNISDDIRKLRAEYRVQAHQGDEIYPVSYRTNDSITVSLNDADGNAYCVIEFTC
jgi:acyl-ACP thioesterase